VLKVFEVTNSDLHKVCNIINDLASKSSRKEIENILTTHKDYKPLKYIFQKALDPYCNYFNVFESLKEDDGNHIEMSIDDFCKNIENGTINLQTEEGIQIFSRIYWGGDEDFRTILQKIVEKNLACGVGAKTINKVFGKIIPVVPYMRCSLPKQVPLESLPWSEGLISQEKADGMFVNINYYPNGVLKCFSRVGSEFSNDILFKHSPNSLEVLKLCLMNGYQTHGEMLVLHDGAVLPREEGNGLLNSILQGGELPEGHVVRFVIWDTVPLENALNDVPYEVSYRERFAALTRYLLNEFKGIQAARSDLIKETFEWRVLALIPTKVVHSLAEAKDHYRTMIQSGKEGTILKTMGGIWKNGTSKNQVKLKLVVDCDLEICGFEDGKGKFKSTFGAIRCKSADGLLEVSVSGLDDATRSVFSEHRDSLIGKVIAVRFNDVMQPKEEGELASLFLPRFVELRTDKTVADTYQQVLDAQSAAIAGA
jgi:DNA ligase-1